jgi:hypothetical protein
VYRYIDKQVHHFQPISVETFGAYGSDTIYFCSFFR